MKRITLSLMTLGVITMADSVDKVLSDEAHKIKRLQVIKDKALKDIEAVTLRDKELVEKYHEDLKALNDRLAEGKAEVHEAIDSLEKEIEKADKAIERLSK